MSDLDNTEFLPVTDSNEGVTRFHTDLYKIARRELARMSRSGTIDTVALVNETFLRAQSADKQWNDRGHFLASMTKIMRHFLVDYARERGAKQRGGDWLRVTTGQLSDLQVDATPHNIVALNAAMSDLGKRSQRLETLVELKVFAGLTIDELAQALNISPATVSRDLRLASAFLRDALGSAS